MSDIPHFKEVIIMAFDCESCGFKTSEVRAGFAKLWWGMEVAYERCSLTLLEGDLFVVWSLMFGRDVPFCVAAAALERYKPNMDKECRTRETLFEKWIRSYCRGREATPVLPTDRRGNCHCLHRARKVAAAIAEESIPFCPVFLFSFVFFI